MALHAVDDLSDAYRATRGFLLPFELGRWLRLAVLSLFVAGSSGGGSPPTGIQSSVDAAPALGHRLESVIEEIGQVLEANMAFVLGVIALAVLVGIVAAWIAATFEFAFVESLRAEEVHVRQYLGEFAGMGTRLFAFRLVFGLGVAVVFGGIVLLTLIPAALGGTAAPLLFLLVLLPVMLVLGLLAGAVYVLTTAFVVPIMILEERTLLSAWGRFWRTLKGNWEQFLVFLLVGIFVLIIFGIVVGIVTAILGVVVAIPFGLLGVGIFFATGAGVTPLLIAILGVPLFLIFLIVGAFVQVPFQTYLRYWALLILGDVEAELDLIPDQRAAVREQEST